MTTDRRAALVEKVARRMGEVISLWLHEHPGCVLEDVDTAYIATAAIDLIRAETLEEAARCAEIMSGSVRRGNIADALYIPPTAKEAAAAIRALKEKP